MPPDSRPQPTKAPHPWAGIANDDARREAAYVESLYAAITEHAEFKAIGLSSDMHIGSLFFDTPALRVYFSPAFDVWSNGSAVDHTISIEHVDATTGDIVLSDRQEFRLTHDLQADCANYFAAARGYLQAISNHEQASPDTWSPTA